MVHIMREIEKAGKLSGPISAKYMLSFVGELLVLVKMAVLRSLTFIMTIKEYKESRDS